MRYPTTKSIRYSLETHLQSVTGNFDALPVMNSKHLWDHSSPNKNVDYHPLAKKDSIFKPVYNFILERKRTHKNEKKTTALMQRNFGTGLIGDSSSLQAR